MKNPKKICVYAESIQTKLAHLLSKLRMIIRRNVFFTGTGLTVEA